MSDKASLFAMLFGPTQTAKSTFINTTCKEKKAKVGDGSGESVTGLKDLDDVRICPVAGRNMIFQDTPGTNDTRHVFTNSDLYHKMFTRLVLSGQSKVRICLVESLGGDSIGIKDSFLNLKQTFGEDVARSIVVLLTKPNMVK